MGVSPIGVSLIGGSPSGGSPIGDSPIGVSPNGGGPLLSSVFLTNNLQKSKNIVHEKYHRATSFAKSEYCNIVGSLRSV